MYTEGTSIVRYIYWWCSSAHPHYIYTNRQTDPKQIRLGVGEKLPGMNKYSPIPDKVGDSHKPMERGSVMLKSGHSCDANQGPAGILALAPAQ